MSTIVDHINLAKHALLTYTKSENQGKNFSLTNKETPLEVSKNYVNLHVFQAGVNGIDYCHVFLNEGEKKVVVAFRGTTSEKGKAISDWTNNMKQNLVQFAVDHPDAGVQIHQGYSSSIDGLSKAKNKTGNTIGELLALWKGESKAEKIQVTGHSKGGALAGLFAARFSHVFGTDNTYVVTFAAPKLGNQKFKDYYKTLVKEHHRYENVYDLVPQLPLVNMGLGRARALAIKTFIPAAKVLFQDTEDKFEHIGERAILITDESLKTVFSKFDDKKYYKAAVAASFLNSVREVKWKFKKVPDACVAQHSMDRYLKFLEDNNIKDAFYC